MSEARARESGHFAEALVEIVAALDRAFLVRDIGEGGRELEKRVACADEGEQLLMEFIVEIERPKSTA